MIYKGLKIPSVYTSIFGMKSTRSQLKRIPGVTCLYRHERTNVYYGIKKVRGKIKTEMLKTEDFTVAKRKLKEWVASHETRVGEMTLADLFARFRALKAGNKPGTQACYDWVERNLKERSTLWNTSVHEILPSDMGIFLGSLPPYKPSTFNKFVFDLIHLFDLAVADGYIVKNPVRGIPNVLKKNPRRKPFSASIEQFNQIVEYVRSGRGGYSNEDDADWIEFLGLAGIGEAELRNLRWEHFDWKRGRITFVRVKTGVEFYVPFYAWLEAFVIKLWKRRGKPKTGKVFERTNSINNTLRRCSNDLGLPHSNPRSLRSFCIVRLLHAGMSPKLVAKFQGHQDQGVLVLKVYSEVISEMDSDYEKDQLAKLK